MLSHNKKGETQVSSFFMHLTKISERKIPDFGDFICNSYCVGLERLIDAFIV